MIKVDLNPPTRILGQFALIAIVGLPLLCAVVLKFTTDDFSWGRVWLHPAILVTAAVAIVQLLLFRLGVQFATKAIYLVLTLVAAPIGFVLSHVFMAAIYYLVITPIGLLFRLIGRDAIGRKIDPSLQTYWHDRGTPRPSTSYFKLY